MRHALRTLRSGVKSLYLHPMRSLLTVLGIFIGVASVIWLLAIGEGISRKAQEQIESLGADNIIVSTIKPPNEALSSGTGGRMQFPEYGLTRADYSRLTETIPTVVKSAPLKDFQETFQNGRRKIDGRLVGCTADYVDVVKIEMFDGRFFTDQENDEARDYCVLGSGVAEKLFPYEEPLGKLIRVGENYYFRVIGVAKSRAPSAAIGSSVKSEDYSFDVYVPLKTMETRVGDTVVVRRSGSMEGETVQLKQITLKVKDVASVMETADLIKMTLDDYHSKFEDYGVTVPLELLEQAKTTRMMFNVFMGLIAGISLVVGGIGIMNIMLATVTERTREIGIRRALGAKRGDIVRQFLIETIVLSVVGGGLGVLVGLTCSPATTFAMSAIKRANPELIASLPPIVQELKPIIVYWSVPLAFMISIVIGVVFGVYPAIRAAKMDPIEALRHE